MTMHTVVRTHQKGFSYQIFEQEDSALPQQGILPISARKTTTKANHRCLEKDSFHCALTQSRDPEGAPGSSGSLGLRGKEVTFFELEWGSNHKPRASEENALSTPPRPTWLWHI